jgi:hypothetical protein
MWRVCLEKNTEMFSSEATDTMFLSETAHTLTESYHLTHTHTISNTHTHTHNLTHTHTHTHTHAHYTFNFERKEVS